MTHTYMRRGRRPFKVPYELIRAKWQKSQREMTGLTKRALARELGVSVALVRGVINETGLYRYAEQRAKEAAKMDEQTPQGRKNGMMFFPNGIGE